MNRDSSHYLFLLLRYWWLLILVGGLVSGAAFWWSSSQPAQFSADTTLFIGNALESADPESQQLETSVRLAAVYAELARNYSVLLQTVEALELEETPEELKEHVSAQVIGETPFLTISVTYPDPEIAASVANTVAESLLASSINHEMNTQVQRLVSLQERITNLEDLIDITNSEYQIALRQLETARDIDANDIDPALADRVASLTDQLNSAYSALSELTSEYIKLSNSTNRIEIVEQARPNYNPQGLGSAITGAAGLIFGVMVAGIFVIGIDAMDNTVRTESQVRHIVSTSLIGRIPSLRISRRRYMKLLHSGELINQNFSELYRSIISDLVFSAPAEEKLDTSMPVANQQGGGHTTPKDDKYPSPRIFVVASPRPKTGCTFTAVNLAVMSASYGLRTLLIDGDLRNPTIAEYFQSGMSLMQDRIAELLRYLSDRPVELESDNELVQELQTLLIRSGQGYENLSVFRGEYGFSEFTSNTNLMTFNKLRQNIDAINELMHFDLVIVDSSPLLTSNDTVNMTAHLNGEILLLVESGSTKREDAQKAVEHLARRNIPIQGAILNRV